MFKRYIILIVLFASTLTNLTAQDVSLDDDTVVKDISKNAEKVDEFGRIGDCGFSGRIDVWLSLIHDKPDSRGYVIVYKGLDSLPAQYDENTSERRVLNHIAYRRFDSSRITLVRGGFRSETVVELWIVPDGAAKPEPSGSLPAPIIPTNRTFLFDTKLIFSDFFGDPLADLILPAVKNLEELENIEAVGDNILEAVEATGETQTPEEIEAEKFSWVSDKYGEFLKKHARDDGVIIFYVDDAHYDVAQVQQFVEKGKLKISVLSEIGEERSKVVFGGYRSSPEVEFWIVPKNGSEPIPKPQVRPVEDIEN